MAGVGSVADDSGGWDTTVSYDHTAVLILALDTTTRGGSIAITRDQVVAAVVEGDASRTHGERLPEEIQRVLTAAGVAAADLDLLVVASGPGAFTGLRIGIAAIQGLSMVVGAPVIGISALDALAELTWPAVDTSVTTLAAWMDAARGEVFAVDYTRSGQSDPVVASPAAILSTISPNPTGIAFVGDGASRYRADILAWAPHSAILPLPVALAPTLALIGGRRVDAAGPPHALQPLYIRRPDPELERLRRSGA